MDWNQTFKRKKKKNWFPLSKQGEKKSALSNAKHMIFLDPYAWTINLLDITYMRHVKKKMKEF